MKFRPLQDRVLVRRIEQEVIGESALVVCQLEIPMDTVVHAGAIVAANGKSLLLNPSPVQTLSWSLL